VLTRVYCTNGDCQNRGEVKDDPEFDAVVNDHGEAICVPCWDEGARPEHDHVRAFEVAR
jgi:hypothetical protein